jgi:hypothetical protein
MEKAVTVVGDEGEKDAQEEKESSKQRTPVSRSSPLAACDCMLHPAETSRHESK